MSNRNCGKLLTNNSQPWRRATTQAQVQLSKVQNLLEQIEQLKHPKIAPRSIEPAQVNAQLLVGPTITLVDPILPSTNQTRGLVKVTMPKFARADQAVSQIVGRVSAPAGLLTLTVNATPVTANSAGVFAHTLPLNTPSGEVKITAIDQQGKRSDLAFQFIPQANPQSTQDRTRQPKQVPNLGAFKALLIGNSQYQHLPTLETPNNDITRLEKLLTQHYDFEVTVLRDATRYEILSELNRMRAALTSNDNLLVYYAGHGELDRTNMRGHWLPVDAEVNNTANWISNVSITDILNVIRAKQIMLVVDSCYSGTLTRSSIAQLDTAMTAAERETWLNLLAQKKSRVVLTSGGLSPVLDIGGGSHSVFAKAFLDVLEANTDLLTGRSLYQAVAARVAHAASQYEFEQIPAYAPIARSGHEAGDFLLLPTVN